MRRVSQVLINKSLAELDRLKRIGGTHRESVVREAFKDLLKGWGRQHEPQFIPDYKLDSATKDTDRFADHKERVIELLRRLTTVSLRTVQIVDAMRQAPR